MVVHLDFGGETPGVAKFYNVVVEMDEASVARLSVIVLLVLGAGGYDGLLEGDKGIFQRHGSKKAKSTVGKESQGGEKNDGTHMVGGGLDGAENRNMYQWWTSLDPFERKKATTYKGGFRRRPGQEWVGGWNLRTNSD